MSSENLQLLSELDDEQLCSAIESILLVAASPVETRAFTKATGCSRERIQTALRTIQRQLRRGILLQIHGDEAQLVTAPENLPVLQNYLGTTRPAGLSRAALETLAIVAYQQPVTRPEIESRRGVNSDRALHTLLARGLVEERGQRNSLGKPMEYGTGFGFLEYFGLGSLSDLPPLIGEAEKATLTPAIIGMRIDKTRQEK